MKKNSDLTTIHLKRELVTLSKQSRLYNLETPIIAITGSIGTGKTSICNLITKSYGFPIVSADALIKKIYLENFNNDVTNFIKTRIESFNNQIISTSGDINFKILREIVFLDEGKKEVLEKFLYPKLEKEFLKEAQKLTTKNQFIFYDVPLLFEKQLNSKVDQTVVIYASSDKQIDRVVQRDGSDISLAKKIINSQISIEEKKRLANFVIDNNSSTFDENKIKQEIKRCFQFLFETI